MKKFNFLALAVLSIVLVTGCGDDKKKKQVGLSFIGSMTQNCQPANPQAIPQQAYAYIQQQCMQQMQQNPALGQLMQQRAMSGQPMNYNATYIVPPTPYGFAQPQGQFFNQQQPYGAQQQVQMTGVTFY